MDLEPKINKITQDDPGMDQGTRVKGEDMQCRKGVLIKDTHPRPSLLYTYMKDSFLGLFHGSLIYFEN